MGDCHARFCERLELKCSGLLDCFSHKSFSMNKFRKDKEIGRHELFYKFIPFFCNNLQGCAVYFLNASPKVHMEEG